MAKLQLIFDGQIKQEYELNKPELSIGRHSTNDIVIENRGISGKHAVIQIQGEKFIIKDLDSTNGTKLNGKKITSAELKHGDHINLFKHTLHFVLLSFEQKDSEQTSTIKNSVPSYAESNVDPDGTIMLDANHVKNMVSGYKPEQSNGENNNSINQPLLEVTSADGVSTISLSNKAIIIGKKNNCDIKTGGWFFTPDISAVIKKDMSGMYTIKPETTIKLNNKKIKNKHILKNGDQILVRNTLVIFII